MNVVFRAHNLPHSSWAAQAKSHIAEVARTTDKDIFFHVSLTYFKWAFNKERNVERSSSLNRVYT